MIALQRRQPSCSLPGGHDGRATIRDNFPESVTAAKPSSSDDNSAVLMERFVGIGNYRTKLQEKYPPETTYNIAWRHIQRCWRLHHATRN